MACRGRTGTWLLLAGGVVVAGVMAYSLMLDDPRSPSSPYSAATEVAVLFPDRNGWLDFRRGAELCAKRGQIQVVRVEPDSLVVVCPRQRREVRFVWYRARGSVETRDVVQTLIDRPDPPAAVIGSSNTALTVDLALALDAAVKPEGPGPVLIVPWATSVHTVSGPRDDGPVRLLDLYPSRTFRFNANNEREAELLVSCLADNEPETPPARILMAVDSADPYSTDLADCFRAAIRKIVPEAPLTIRTELITSSGVELEPSKADVRWAEGTWKTLQADRKTGPAWLVLPLQAEPTRRLLVALRTQARAHPASPGPVRVLCGDTIGIDILAEFARVPGLSVWIYSSGCGPHLGVGAAHDEHVPAEIITALTLAIDRSTSPKELRSALRRLNLDAKDPAALCRSLAFDASGERRGDDVGQVLSVGPDEPHVMSYAPGPDATWTGPVPVSAPKVASSP